MKQNGNGEPNGVADNDSLANRDEVKGEKLEYETNDTYHDVDNESSEGDNLDSVFDLRRAQISLAKLSCFTGIPMGANEYLLETMKRFNPLFHVSPSQYEKDILQVFQEEKAMAKGVLVNLDSQICLSVDTFFSSDDKWKPCKHYLQLSAHFIDDKWKLKKWVLKFRRAYSIEGEALDEAVLNALRDWEIEGKVFSLTMVGAHIDYDLVETFKQCVEEKKKLPLGGKLFGVDCCAPILDRMAEDAYKAISGVIRKVEELISWKFAPVWYLPAHKLKEALELNSMGEFSTQNIGDRYDVPSVEEWEKARFVSNLVTSVYEIAKTLFETKYPTANNFLHKFQELREMLFQEASGADKFKSKVAKKMLWRLDKYWDGMSLTLAITSVMDPRFKMRYFDYLSSKGEISGNKLQPSVILDAIRSLYLDYVTSEGNREYPVGNDSSSSDPKTVKEEECCGSVQMQDYIHFIQPISESPKSDLGRYLEDPVVSWSQDFQVLSWWRVEGTKYPTLSKMARDVLAIPMSVATSYGAYYKEREANPHISSLGTDEIKNALVCAPTWEEKPFLDEIR